MGNDPENGSDAFPIRDLPSVENCITHLRLLYALRKLRLQIGYEDGLWGIWNSRVHGKGLQDDDLQKGLSKIREKRWALFLARAVHRYTVWWSAFKTKPLTFEDTLLVSGPRYANYGTQTGKSTWGIDNMMPLDVLMVWHTHMLNPRTFLEDTMRLGMGDFWASGMPWHLVEACINSDSDYDVPPETKYAWTQRTGLAWSNLDDPPLVDIPCPVCPSGVRLPWTTCDSDSNTSDPKRPLHDRLNLVGNGYGDGNLRQTCPDCNILIDSDLLCVAKFARHAQDLVKKTCPMPGTLLDPPTGTPERNYPLGKVKKTHAALTAPNRLVADVLYERIQDLAKNDAHKVRPTMAAVRRLVHKALEDDESLAIMSGDEQAIMIAGFSAKLLLTVQQHKQQNGQAPGSSRAGQKSKKLISAKLGTVVRRMLAQYGGGNHSPFGLDLCGAVVRQGLFIDKMYKFDWLHTNTAIMAIQRAIVKYQRFLVIAKGARKQMVVPTLDVDLIWHTHQLTPTGYYRMTTGGLFKLLDHDDKVDETKLSTAFEWMCNTYFDKYNEVYSECICWYCESIRGPPPGKMSSMFGMSEKQKAIKQLHETTTTTDGLHISAHNAVKTPPARERHWTLRQAYEMHLQRREEGLKRGEKLAKKLAKKLGRPPPGKQERFDHWGYPVLLGGAFACPVFLTAAMYADDLARPEAMSGVNADGNIGGCVTGCGGLTQCGATTGNLGGGSGFGAGGGASGAVTDMFDASYYDDGGGGDGGGCGGCGGGD